MSSANIYSNTPSLPRLPSHSSNRSIHNKRSESISAVSTISSLSSSSTLSGRRAPPHFTMTSTNQQQQYSMSPPSASIYGSEYNRPSSSYYSYATSDYDGARYQQPQYNNQPLPETPTSDSASPSDFYFVKNGPTSPRLNPYNRSIAPSINTSNRDFGFDTRNTYVNESPTRLNPSASLSNPTKVPSNDKQLIFPPTEEMRLKTQ